MGHQVSTSFPDSTYTSSVKPQAVILQADIQALETAHNALDTDVTADEATIALLKTGWVTATGTWSATDANTISVASTDLTAVIQRGDKIKVTNNSTVKYYYISTTPAFSTDTTFDVAGEVDLVAGAITLPYYSKIDNPQGFKKGEIWYKAKAYPTSDQNLPDAVITNVSLGTEEYDTNSNFAANAYNVPVSGYYRVDASLYTNSGAGKIYEVRGVIRKNGSDLKFLSSQTTTGATVYMLLTSGWYVGFFTKGDAITLACFVDSSDASAVNCIAGGSSSMSIQFISI